MRRLFLLLIMFTSSFVYSSSTAQAQDLANICANTAIPAGWVLVGDLHNSITCGSPINPLRWNMRCASDRFNSNFAVAESNGTAGLNSCVLTQHGRIKFSPRRFASRFEVLAYERSLVKKEGRWTHSGGLLQSFPTLDNLRNFLLKPMVDMRSFL